MLPIAGVRDSIQSALLRSLVTPGSAFPDLSAHLESIRGAADWDSAEKEGRVVPAPGVDEAYDAAER